MESLLEVHRIRLVSGAGLQVAFPPSLSSKCIASGQSLALGFGSPLVVNTCLVVSVVTRGTFSLFLKCIASGQSLALGFGPLTSKCIASGQSLALGFGASPPGGGTYCLQGDLTLLLSSLVSAACPRPTLRDLQLLWALEPLTLLLATQLWLVWLVGWLEQIDACGEQCTGVGNPSSAFLRVSG